MLTPRSPYAEGALPTLRSRCALLLALFITLLSIAHPARGATWDWQLSADRYKQLNQFERAQYDKAAALITGANFTAAASEFEKFKVQFPDSPLLGYSLFMRGYALQQAKQRNAAVKAYQEVLDYFSDQTDDAAAALYYMGVAHLENGDTRKGLQCMKALAEDPRYQKKPLAAGALRRLADNYWNNKEPQAAVKYWRQAIEDFGATNDVERELANTNLADYTIIARDYPAYETFYLNDPAHQTPEFHRWLAENVYQKAVNLYDHPESFDRKKRPSDKELAEERQSLYLYLQTAKPWWAKQNDLWDYYEHNVRIQTHYLTDKVERDRQIDEAVSYLRTLLDKAHADDCFDRLIDLCREGGAMERARFVAAQMTDRVHAGYKEYEVLWSEQKYEQAVKQLETVEAAGQPAWADRAMNERARVYREALNKQPEAIALYQRINKPPATLWGIQECYKRMGKLDQSLNTLSEIENLFPMDASRAAWTKAAYLNEAGDKKRAIVAAKHVAIAYKSAPEASQAHTMLEGFGIHLVGGESEAKEQ